MIRIVLAEDQAMVRGALATMLGLEADVEVVAEVGRGDEIVPAAMETRPDVALLDIGMPLLDGYEVARRIRSEPWGPQLFLVAVSGWGQSEDRQRATDAGFDLHFRKPIGLPILEGILEKAQRLNAETVVKSDT